MRPTDIPGGVEGSLSEEGLFSLDVGVSVTLSPTICVGWDQKYEKLRCMQDSRYQQLTDTGITTIRESCVDSAQQKPAKEGDASAGFE